MVESVVEESDVSGCETRLSEMSGMSEMLMPESAVQGVTVPENEDQVSEITESEEDASEIPVSPVPESGEVIVDTPDSTPGILLPEPHVTMHNLSRGITLPIRLPVTAMGNGPLLIHVTSDARWIEVANTPVTIDGTGGVHVTLNTGNMDSKGFQQGCVMLRAGEIQEEIFLFVSVMPEM